MFQICICCNDKIFSDNLSKNITEITANNKIHSKTDLYSSVENLLFDIEEFNINPDLVLVDINLDSLVYSETIAKIKSSLLGAIVVFMSGTTKFISSLMDIVSFNFLAKENITYEDLQAKTIKAYEISNKKKHKLFVFKKGHNKSIIATNRILYFEIINRIVSMHCIDDNIIDFYGTMETLEKELQARGFIRIHRSYLLNTLHISTVNKKSVTCINGDMLPIGNKYIQNVNVAFANII